VVRKLRSEIFKMRSAKTGFRVWRRNWRKLKLLVFLCPKFPQISTNG
jgi:hypothetical protein